MSGFFAVIYGDREPPETSVTERMGRHILFRGCEPMKAARVHGALLCHSAFPSTYSSVGENQPLVCADSGIAVISDARIDDRPRLIGDLLKAGVCVSCRATDSELILASYKAWSDGLCEYLLGDFSFVVWDWRNGKLLAGRDHFGMRRIYFGEVEGTVVLSNQLAAVLAFRKIDCTLDQLALADFLLFGDVNALDSRLTPFKGIRMVGLAELRSWSRALGSQSSRYWTIPDHVETFRYGRDAEVGERFRTVLKGAVKDRVQSSAVVCALSGGLDSTTMSYFASELYKEGSGPGALNAFTAVSGPDQEEARLAGIVADQLGIEHHVRVIKKGAPMVNRRHAPFPSADLHNYQVGTLRQASLLGKVSLVGHSADYGFAFEQMTLLRLLREVGLSNTLSCRQVLAKAYGYRPPLGSGLKRFFRFPFSARHMAPARTKFPVFPTWIRPEISSKLGLENRWAEYWARKQPGDHRLRPRATSWLLSNQKWCLREDDWALDFVPSDAADPFLDLRLLRFLWSLPPIPWFYRKHLVRYAMKGLLPDEILVRPKTHAGPWLNERPPAAFLQGWKPSAALAEIVSYSRFSDSVRDPRKPVELFPCLLDDWLQGVENMIKLCRS